MMHPRTLESIAPSSPSIRYRHHKYKKHLRFYRIYNATVNADGDVNRPLLRLLCICRCNCCPVFFLLLSRQTVKAAARTVTLSAEASLVASAVATGTAFDLRSLKPGMLVDTMVDTVVSNGMLVSHSVIMNTPVESLPRSPAAADITIRFHRDWYTLVFTGISVTRSPRHGLQICRAAVLVYLDVEGRT